MTRSNQRLWDRRFLDLAAVASEWSKDPSTKVGCVLTDDIRIIGIGYNGFPRGIRDDEFRLNDRDLKYPIIIHAEENALILNREVLPEQFTCYTWPMPPCAHCASLLIQHGVAEVRAPAIFDKRWRKSAIRGMQMMMSGLPTRAIWLPIDSTKEDPFSEF